MKKSIKKCLFLFLFILIVVIAGAEEIIVSVSDFSVESENSKFKYIGKGISTLVAGELRRTRAIKLLERSQMNKILEEQKFSLSGLVDESMQVELGKLMAADYIIFGEIIDMGNSLLISVRMADVATTEIIWEDSIMEKLETYDYIGAYFAQSILTELKLDVQKETVAKVETKVVKETEAIVALSVGIDAYDRGDEEKAKEELKTVQMLDPENEVAEFYLSKMQAVSPKFKVENQAFTPVYNPASLGFIETDKIFFWVGGASPAPGVEEAPGYNGDGSLVLNDSYYGRDDQGLFVLGVSFPLKDRFGLAMGIIWSLDTTLLKTADESEPFLFDGEYIGRVDQSLESPGAFLSFGVRLREWMSVGMSMIAFYTSSDESDEYKDEYRDEGFSVSLSPGLMLRGPDRNLIFDINMSYIIHQVYYIDHINNTIESGNSPMAIDSSLSYSILDQRLFFGLKGISDIYFDDRGGYALRIIPMVEFWPFKFLSIRGGYEYSHLDQMGEFTLGHGAVGGLTVKIGKFTLHVNQTYRQKPLRLLPGYTVPNVKMMFGLEYSPGWISR